jgi:hypothetical protein
MSDDGVSIVRSACSLWNRKSLEEKLDGPIEPSSSVVGHLVTRLEESRSEPVLQRIAKGMPWVYAAMALGAAAIFVSHPAAPGGAEAVGVILALLGGLVVAVHTAWRALRRQVVVDSITSRVRASIAVAERARVTASAAPSSSLPPSSSS